MSDFYRYLLTREFLVGEGRMAFVMLNPSTADEVEDDPTIRRCISYAKREGCRELLVVNLFARRSTDPDALPDFYGGTGGDPSLGEEGAWFKACASESRYVVAAWGSPSGRVGRLVRERVPIFLEAAQSHGRQLHALGITRSGAPRHPLYVKADAPLRPWPLVGAP